jgi:hypothetical protein
MIAEGISDLDLRKFMARSLNFGPRAEENPQTLMPRLSRR